MSVFEVDKRTQIILAKLKYYKNFTYGLLPVQYTKFEEKGFDGTVKVNNNFQLYDSIQD